MSVLSIIQDHCRIHALNVPSGVISSTDTTTVQLLAILLEKVGEIVAESRFNVTTQEATWSSVANEDQGALATLAPNGYQWIIADTLYDRTNHRKFLGPVSEEQWQADKALPNAGIQWRYRIRQDHLLLNPAPTNTSSTFAFEYASSWPVKSSSGTLKATVTLDDDVFLFPENILKKALAYRWKQVKGLMYQADEAAYYNMLNNYIAKDKVKTSINVGEGCPSARPGVFVSPGSWNV